MLEENPDQISLSDVPAEVMQEWIHFQHTEEFSPDYEMFIELMELAFKFGDVDLYVNCFLQWFKLFGSSEEDVYESEEGLSSLGRRESDEEATSGDEEFFDYDI